MHRIIVVALGLGLGTFAIAPTLHAQGSPITFHVAVPVQITQLHPDIAQWWVTCNVMPTDRPNGVTVSGSWGDVPSAKKSVVNGSIQDTAFVTFRGSATPTAVGQTFQAYCKVRGELSSTALAPTDGMGRARWLEPLAPDPRFRVVAQQGVSATVTIPAAP
jgi:hypothetical protein